MLKVFRLHWSLYVIADGCNCAVQFLHICNCFRAAAMTLRTVLLSLQALLAAAEPDDPQDAVVARQYKEDYTTYLKTAKHWSYKYAGGKIHASFVQQNLCLKKSKIIVVCPCFSCLSTLFLFVRMTTHIMQDLLIENN